MGSAAALSPSDVELVTIYEISKTLSSPFDLEKAMREVLNVLEVHLGLERGMVTLLDESGSLRIAAATGLTSAEWHQGRFATDEEVIRRVARTGVPAVVPWAGDALAAQAQLHSEPHRSEMRILMVPIKSERRCFGVLTIERNERSAVSYQRHIRFLSMVANLMGQTIRLYQAVESDRARLMREKRVLQRELQGKYSLENVVGHSKRMLEVFADVHQAAAGNSTILLRGESGTGKELIARAVHYLGPRKDGPFVKVNCAALPETLIESELFGHEKGSFTGAVREHKGRFEQAHGGTLFLDEIGDVSPAFQTKMLRVLQEREFERVGGTHTIRVDVRLICATNCDLEEAVAKGQFRADLYYRINVVTIFVPPLRERPEDIPDLVHHFLNKFNRTNGRSLVISPEAMQVMMACAWPGNVRELENCVERTALMARGSTIVQQDVPCQKNQCLSTILWKSRLKPIDIPVVNSGVPSVPDGPLGESRNGLIGGQAEASHAETQRERLTRAMEKCGWVQAKAARLLNLTPRQMGYALKKYGIEVKRF
jgi:Nif-specific regulatory protein